MALIASARGYTDPMDLEQFLSDEPYFSDPYEMAEVSHQNGTAVITLKSDISDEKLKKVIEAQDYKVISVE